MSWRRSPWTFSALVIALAATGGCGVKGDPLPPERPPRMGRGRPTYRKAAEKIKLDTRGDDEDEQRN